MCVASGGGRPLGSAHAIVNLDVGKGQACREAPHRVHRVVLVQDVHALDPGMRPWV